MARGLLAPISPNEELTLRRIAGGQSTQALMAERDVVHLTSLGLAEKIDGKLSLTALGRERYARLPNAPALPLTADKADAALVESYIKARGEPSARSVSSANRRAP
jgi:hypothetical protein